MRKSVLIVMLLSVNMLWAEGWSRPIRVGLLLPLHADLAQRDKSMNRYADFYTGALLAVYEMQAGGQQVEVYTYDVGKSVYQLEQVLATDTLNSMDMIIGPVYPAQVREMAEWVRREHVLTLLPFAYEVPELATNPYLLQFNPSDQADAEAIMDDLRMNDSVQFVFVEAEEAAIPTSVKSLLEGVKNEGWPYVYTSVEQIMADSLSAVLAEDKENILVMNIERFANMRPVMPYLERAAQGRQLTLLSRYVWQDEPIIIPQMYTTVFRKEADVDSVDYGRWYRQYVSHERTMLRPNYDLLGYDMMKYVLETVVDLREAQDIEEEEMVIERVFEGLQSDMRFERVDSIGGYQNNNINVVRVR